MNDTDTPAPVALPDAPITAAERFARERFRQALWGGWYAFLASPDRDNDEQVVNYLCTAGWEHIRAERDKDARAIVALAEIASSGGTTAMGYSELTAAIDATRERVKR